MANLVNCLETLRRRIGDTETPYTFEDSLLVGYITDAVDEVELDFKRDFYVDLSINEFNKPLERTDVVLFSIKAHYLFKLRTKDKADRDNFLLKKGRLTLDNSNQSKDHDETLERLEKEYRRLLYQSKNGGFSIKGVRME
jgi:hypothetical protein